MRPITFLLPVLAVACGGRPPPILAPEPGDRVRVTAANLNIREFEGRLRRLHNDSVVVRPEYGGAPPVVIPLSSLTRLEIRRRESRADAGGAYGALAGAAIGVGSAASLCSSIDCEESTGVLYLIFGGGGALAGLVIGSIVGAQITTERWEEIPLDRLRVSFAPQRDGRFGLELSVRF